MKIAIHHAIGSFSEYWIEYCEKKSITYKVVNAYSSNIIADLQDCDAFMWHHHHGDYRDVIFAKALLTSLQESGKKVFPDYSTCWHFDDKLAQKYLLEAINVLIVPTYVFYDKKEAIKWIDKIEYPIVFKLRGGAGAANVRLVKSHYQAKRIVNKAFGNGFPQFNKFVYFKERYRNWRSGKESIVGVLKGIYRFFVSTQYSKMHPEEKGYVYFQKFIPNNETDYRIKVVDGKCWGFQRKVRENDFRASGSGELIFDSSLIPKSLVATALDIAKKLSLQSVAFDFVEDKNSGEFLLVEMSYAFGFDDREKYNGYYDENLQWHSEEFSPFEWMVELMMRGS